MRLLSILVSNVLDPKKLEVMCPALSDEEMRVRKRHTYNVVISLITTLYSIGAFLRVQPVALSADYVFISWHNSVGHLR